MQDNQAVRYEPELPDDRPVREQSLDSVGRILARARVELGYELTGVAAELRIRLPYLQAIEAARYDELPGMPYAIGFVRSYAEFVGLDPEATVALFKGEVRDRANAQQNLSFPAPKPEGRIPGGALILISLLVVALAYGGWYFWNESGRPFVELLPSLGLEQELQLAEAPPPRARVATENPSVEGLPTEGPPAENPPDQSQADRSPAEEEFTEVPGAAESPSPAASPVAEAPAAAEPGPVAAAPVIATEARPTPPAAEAAEPGPAAEAPPAPPAEAGTEGAPAAEQSAAAPALPDESPPDPDLYGSGQAYGEESTAVRVVLVATADSWVQVRGRDEELLFTRVLRPGDSYRVPDRAGLTLLTGNAGGLNVVVDGQRLPTLGPPGAVRRNIPLDADSLRSRLN